MLSGILLNAGLWCGAALLVWGRFRDPVTRLLATLVVGFSVIVVAGELLSLAGQFRMAPVAAVCGLLLALGGGVWLRRRRRLDPNTDNERPGHSHSSRAQPSLALCAVCWLVVVAAVLMAGDGFLYGLISPVQVDSDAPIYHLPFALHWANVGRLEMIPTPFGEEGSPYFPANGDLWLSWLALTLHGAAIIKVGQWPFLVAGGLALYAVARQTGASWAAAAIVGGLWCCLPLTLRQASLANVDLIWTAFYFTALHFVIRFCAAEDEAHARLWDLLLAALALGLVLGTKSLGLLFVPLLLLPLAWRIWSHRPEPERASAKQFRCRAMLVLAAGLLAPSVYWFARNTWLTGNPLYPLNVSFGGVTVFTGMFDATAMRRTAYHIPISEWTFLLAQLRYVCGPVLLALWGTGLLAGFVAGGGDGGRSAKNLLRLLSLLAVAHVALFWCVVPYNSQERFLMPALGLGLLPLARMLTRWPGVAWPLSILVLVHVTLALGAGPVTMDVASFRTLRGESLAELRWWAAGVCGMLGLWAVLRGVEPPTVARRSLFIGVATLIAGWVCLYAGPLQRMSRDAPAERFYPETGFGARMLPAWRIMEQLTRGSPARIAYAGGNLPYYLRGSALANDVRYVNVNDRRHWLPHDYHRARREAGRRELAAVPWPQWDREQSDYDAWLANLRAAKVDLLIVSRVNLHGRIVDLHGELPPYPVERTWAEQHPAEFEDLGPPEIAGTNSWARVYRVRTASLTASRTVRRDVVP